MFADQIVLDQLLVGCRRADAQQIPIRLHNAVQTEVGDIDHGFDVPWTFAHEPGSTAEHHGLGFLALQQRNGIHQALWPVIFLDVKHQVISHS